MTEKQWVAGTVMAHNPEGKYVFLVKKENDKFSFPSTQILSEQTGLACILEELKKKLAIDIHSLNLFELTNAVVDGTNVPLFVFEIPDATIQLTDVLKSDLPLLSWEKSGVLIETLENWKISGVPQF
ncbi:hypothetical protein [Carnobacterium antarcticum]|uniref:Nudix hydrolase domain-containing protein n=1 Tax=Carnobacterium antarcticum TaxID=2126436 RepID=A0ABW4NPF2_9LACT|nr:hypothetical protein [Carnobacterium sp. CP1]ALV22853.1 hypothetical protein NY10_2268 [Carnobacterium sp. CP1]